MNSPKIEVDIVDLLNKLDNKFDRLEEKLDQRFEKVDQKFEKIDDRLGRLEVGQEEIKGEIKTIKTEQNGIKEQVGEISKLEIGQEEIKGEIKAIKTEQSSLKEQVGEIKGSQKAQLWSLIGILATALLGILVAVGKILFFTPKI